MGSPLTTTAVAVCIFDLTAGEPFLVSSHNIPAGAPKWKAPKKGRYRYIDSPGTYDGLRGVRMRSNPKPDRSVVRVRARGQNLVLPTPFSATEFMDVDPTVIIQLRTSEDTCWESQFTEAETFKNTRIKYRARYK